MEEDMTLEGTTLEVVDSQLNEVPIGAKLTVVRDHTNEFTGRRVISVTTDADIHLGRFQLCQQTDGTETKDVWNEIVTGRESDTIAVAAE